MAVKEETRALLTERGMEVLGRLGQGSSGTVVSVRELLTGRRMAVKVVPLGALTETEMTAVALEAALGQRLKHPHLLPILQAYRSPRHFLLYSPMCLDDLGRYLSRQTILADLGTGSDRLHRWSRQLLEGLAYLHQHRYAHRDFKLSNLYITEGEQVVVGDLGSALEVREVELRVSVVVGSLETRGPEQLELLAHCPLKGDVYAAGVALFQLAEGSQPFPWQRFGRRAERVVAAMRAAQLAFEYASPALRHLLRLALHPTPEERPTLEELLHMDFFSAAPLEAPSQDPTSVHSEDSL